MKIVIFIVLLFALYMNLGNKVQKKVKKILIHIFYAGSAIRCYNCSLSEQHRCAASINLPMHVNAFEL